MMLPLGKSLREIIDLAMQDKAPQMHRRLSSNGMLEDEISQRMTVAQEAYQHMLDEPMEKVLERQKQGHLERVADRKRQLRTAAEFALAQATEFPSESGTDSTKGLGELFGGENALRSFPGNLDEETYNKAKPHFQAVLEAFVEAGKSIKDLFKFLIQQFGVGIKPYAIRFAQEQGLGTDLANNQTTQADYATDQEGH